MSLRNLMWHQLMCCAAITHAHSSCYCLLLQSLLCKDSETGFLPPPLPPGRDPLMKVISTAISHLPETGRFMTRPAERKIFFFRDTGGRGKEGGKWMALKTQIDQWAGTKAPLRPNYLQIIRLEINWHQRRNVSPFFSVPLSWNPHRVSSVISGLHCGPVCWKTTESLLRKKERKKVFRLQAVSRALMFWETFALPVGCDKDEDGPRCSRIIRRPNNF